MPFKKGCTPHNKNPNSKQEVTCIGCGISFSDYKCMDRKYCGQSCANKATSNGAETWGGKHLTEETKKKLSVAFLNRIADRTKHPRWIKDRSKLVTKQERNDSAYGAWRKEVWLRDNFTCKIANPDCKGRIEAHHILGWKSHPELRYNINNGITLCHAHHPKRREDETKLSPYFQELVAEMK